LLAVISNIDLFLEIQRLQKERFSSCSLFCTYTKKIPRKTFFSCSPYLGT